ncbi:MULTISPECIES: Asp23/Gls24 family envelope stress response protein [Actinomadura]|uniref:Asp23/Gls24 family envelope stress response protein n=1 Tax=Actinomadura yumaensis TaxID=111807 RepID=A0ABW2CZY7_9ACTN|nr:Asp23/Gls24 family envelope stress response protein [Actinomadura sp. J1-007]MWK36460.1 Asp23/Gls24 family envelope stress response protein [Actinomadura sp. J1-007]
MTATAERPDTADAGEDGAPERRPAPRPARERGTTTIADRVVARIATHAAGETEHARGARRSVLGVNVPGGRSARTDVTVKGNVVTARVEMAVHYPAPVRQVTRGVRDRVREQVEEMTGLTVRQVDIEVAALERAEEPRETGRTVQ